MALTTCPECRQSVSDQAATCPNCGYPFQPPRPREDRRPLWWGLGCLLAIPALFVGVAFVGLLAAIAIPSFVKARNESQVHVCIRNLHQLEAAKTQAAAATGKAPGSPVSEADLTPYLKSGFAGITCPSGGRYTLNPVGEEPACSTHGRASSIHTTAMRPSTAYEP